MTLFHKKKQKRLKSHQNKITISQFLEGLIIFFSSSFVRQPSRSFPILETSSSASAKNKNTDINHVRGRPFIMYAQEEGVKTSNAFPISVMLKKCKQGGGQIWPKNAHIINGRSFKRSFYHLA